MDSLSLKDQLDAWFKLSDAIDRFWQMFIYVTAAVLIFKLNLTLA